MLAKSFRFNRKFNLLAGLFPILLLLLSSFDSALAEDSRFFPETGHTVSGKFLDYWNNNGGLATFGFPITEATNEVDPETGKTFLTQWFERNRFELHPENAGTKYEVLLGLLGKDLRREALAVDPDFQRADRINNTAQDPNEQAYFDETGHNLRFQFLDYWRSNGGLERFGFPISEVHKEVDPETGNVFETQWFERARFEFHPDNPDPYKVLLGLLGKQIRTPLPGNIEFSWKIGEDFNGLKNPGAIAIDKDDNIYVMDRVNYRIQKFDNNGNFLVRWGSYGSGNGQFLSLTGLVIDKQGLVYVVDSASKKIQKFDNRGNFLDNLLVDLEPNATATAIDNQDNIYITFSDTFQVHKYDNSGHELARWNLKNNYPSPIYNPIYGIAVDLQGNSFVVVDGGAQKYDPNGNLLLQWGSGCCGEKDGQFVFPSGIATDVFGNVYVADSTVINNTIPGYIVGNHVQKFDNNGNFLAKYGSFGTGDNQFNNPQALAIDNQGNIFVADSGNNRIQKFNSNGQFLTKWGSKTLEGGYFNAPCGVAVDGKGNLYIADTGNQRIQKIDATGHFQASWGGTIGSGVDQFLNPNSLAVDFNSNIFVADTTNHRIKKLNSNGQVLSTWGGHGEGDGQFQDAFWVAVDMNGDVYVADKFNHRIQVFDNQGKFLRKWGELGGGNQQFGYYSPDSVAVDKLGNVYVSDSSNQRIIKFDKQGNFLANWHIADLNGKSYFFTGIGIDKDNFVYLSATSGEILKLNGDSNLITKYGSYGNGDGQFNGPCGIAIDNSGNIFVADRSNDRIQKLIQH